jgi:cation transport regulator
MPYATDDDLPPAVRSALPSDRLRTAFRKAFNAAHEQYDGDEQKAFKVAWAAIGRIAVKGPDGKWKPKAGMEKPVKKDDGGMAAGLRRLLKALGAEQPGDGGDGGDGGNGGDGFPPAGTAEPVELSAEPQLILKVDEDRRLLTGWFTVCTKGGEPVVDLQGHVVPVDVCEDAYVEYMMDSRRGNDMHVGEPDAVVVECLTFTKAKQDALGIDLGMEGTFGTMKVLNEEKWAEAKAGARPMFSIGGQAWFDKEDAE